MTACRLSLALLLVSALAWSANGQETGLVNEGLAALKQGKTDDAIGFFNQAIQANPADSRAYCARAYAYTEVRDFADATRDCGAAIKLDPHFAKAYSVLGNICWMEGDQTDAAIAFDKAVSLAPNDPDILYNRALYYLRKNPERTVNDCTAVIRLQPDNGQAYYIKGDAYFDQQQYDEAIQAYTEAIRLKPDTGNIYHQRGLAYQKKGELDDAIEDFTNAIRLKPKSDVEYFARGYIHAEEHDYDKAIADYTEAILLNPKMGGYYYQRGLVYQQEGNKDLATQDLNEANQLNGHAK